MAMMATTRREMEAPSFPWFLVIFLPLFAVGLQAYLPLRFPRLDIFNLPLLVVIYVSVTRRSPISGTLTGMVVGLMQDALTHRPLGINGISETVVGFLGASIGIKIDVENTGARALLSFVFTLLYGFLYLLILRHLVGVDLHWSWWHQALKAAINAIVGMILFAILDKTKQE
jgi:rod shape-determining protein MreD